MLSASVTPTNATNKGVAFASTKTSVATVDKNTGRVTAVGKGTCDIIVTTDDGDFQDSVTITVDIIPVVQINVYTPGGVSSVAQGKTLQFTARVNETLGQKNPTNSNVIWSASDSSVATITTAGLLTGKSAGSVVVTATAADGQGAVSVPVTITVTLS